MNMKRLEFLDALRGFAMLWMTLYHFCFDLNYFGWIYQDFYADPFWVWQRCAIVSLFLFCVGWSQAASSIPLQPAKLESQYPQGLRDRWMSKFWLRWWQIAGCALLVTLCSYAVYPKSFIYFGVLHAVCVMLLLLLVLRYLGQWLWLLGAAWLLLFLYPPFVANSAPWNVLGLISQKPITEDYVPLFPWLALVCFGYAFGLLQIKKGWTFSIHPWAISLAVLGRYSLRYYMLHQPVLIGLLYLCRLA